MKSWLAAVMAFGILAGQGCTRQPVDKGREAASTPKPPAEIAQEATATETPCPLTRVAAEGRVLELASEGDRVLIGDRLPKGDPENCPYDLGELRFSGGRTIRVIAVRDNLYFIRDRSVFLGVIASGLSEVKVEGTTLVGKTGDGRVVRVPISSDGPPTRMFGSENSFFEANPGDRSDVAYARALRQPMGARYDECDDPRAAGAGVRRVRALLTERAVLLPDELGDASCIWREGAIRGENAKLYEVYTYHLSFGLKHNPHSREYVVVVEGGGRFLEVYDQTGLDVAIDGADLLIGEWESGEPKTAVRNGDLMRPARLHFGKTGPPGKPESDMKIFCVQWPDSDRCVRPSG